MINAKNGGAIEERRRRRAENGHPKCENGQQNVLN